MKKSVRAILAGVSAIAMLSGLAACAGPGAQVPQASTSSEKVSTDVSKGNYNLTLWDGAGLKPIDDDLIKAFQKKYPNIKVKATYDPDNVSAQNGPRIISAASTPDIARITDINSAVRGKHLVNLDEYAKAYGWNLPSAQTEVYRVDSKGKIGDGSLYAIPDGVSMTGMYWNKDLAKKAGIDKAPTTVDELVADMEAAKKAGILPMMMPAKEGGTSYIYQALVTNLEGRQKVQDWIIQKDGATFKTDGAVKAAATIQQWNKAGYFSKDALALDGSTALARFTKGGALFFPSGSWYSDSIFKALGDKAGFFAFPGTEAGKGSAAANAVTAFGIPANSKNKNAAAAFLNFLHSEDARQIAVNNGYPAVGTGERPATDNLVLKDILTAYDEVVKSGNTTDYINNATAGMQASAIIPGLQNLLNGTYSAQKFVDSLQSQYEKELK